MREPRKWEFVIPGVPGVKDRHRQGRSGSGKGRHGFTPDRTVDYERLIAGAAIVAGLRVGDGDCDITIIVWLSDRRRKDPDNIEKVVLDGLQKAGPMALADDSIFHIRNLLIRRGGADRARPGLEIEIVEVTDPAQCFIVDPAPPARDPLR